jgi:uncharacterized protein (TIGR00369 family)
MAGRNWFRPEFTAQVFNDRMPGSLPALLGLQVRSVSAEGLSGRFDVRPDLLAPNGFLHAASVVALADTLCGFGCVANLPQGAAGFTTIELKANYLGTAREGGVSCRATPAHLGRTTQVWDALVAAEGDGRTIAMFRCTQLVLWPDRPGAAAQGGPPG